MSASCQSRNEQNATIIKPAPLAPRKFCHRLTPIFTDAENAVCKSVFHLCPSVTRQISHNDRFSFGHNQHFVLNTVNARGFSQTFQRFFEWFVPETETSIMHWHERPCLELLERPHCLFGIHVNFTGKRRIVSANRQERYFD